MSSLSKMVMYIVKGDILHLIKGNGIRLFHPENHYLVDFRTWLPFVSGVQVVGDLMVRIQRIQDFTPKLLLVRKRLLGLEPEGPM